MYRFISFWHNPDTGDIKVSDLTSHSRTAEALGLDDKVWREGHYLPNGSVKCRVLDTDRKTSKECEDRLLSKWPTFIEFWEMCIEKGGEVNRTIDLRDCPGLRVLPENLKVNGSLYLSGCPGLRALPENLTVKGTLYLNDCPALKSLPENLKAGKTLYLRNCPALKSLPENLKVGAFLDLRGCMALKSLPENLKVGRHLILPNHLKETSSP